MKKKIKEIRCPKHSFVVYPENKWCVVCASEEANKERKCEDCGKMANFNIGHLCLKNHPAPKTEWEREFDKIAPAYIEMAGKVCDLRPAIIPIKKLIGTLLSQATASAEKRGLREGIRTKWGIGMEIIDEGNKIRKSEREKCIKEHSFLAGKILREERAKFHKILEGLKKWAEEKEFKIPMNEYDNGFNQAVSEINKKILEKLKELD